MLHRQFLYNTLPLSLLAILFLLLANGFIQRHVSEPARYDLENSRVLAGQMLDEFFQRTLTAMEGIATKPALLQGKVPDILTFLRSEQTHLNNPIEVLGYVTKEGVLHLTEEPPISLSHEVFFSRLASGEQIISSQIGLPSRKQNYLFFLMPVYDENGLRSGALAAGVKSDALLAMLNPNSQPGKPYFALLDEQGQVIRPHYIANPLEVAAQSTTEPKGSTKVRSGEKSLIVHYSEISSSPLKVLQVIPDRIIMQGDRTLQFGLMGILALCIAITIASSIIVNRKMLGPIEILNQSLRSFGSGQRSVRIPDLGGDEIGEMGRSFNAMADAIKEQELARIASDAERRKLEEKLRHTERMRALGRLAGGIAHDFNNVVNTIVGHIELLTRATQHTPQTDQYFTNIKQATRRAKDIVEQMQLFSYDGDMTVHTVSMRDLVQEATNHIRINAPKNVRIATDFRADIDLVLGNSAQLLQVLLNLCNNAVQAVSPDDGLISIQLAHKTLTNSQQIGGSLLKEGSYVTIRIRDNGYGIAPEVLGHVFDPFFTSKETGLGSGLGLAVVHGIVASHGGTISVDSDGQSGTEFEIYFPAAPDNLKVSPAESEVKVSLSSKNQGIKTNVQGRHILLVEDEKLQADMLQEILVQEGLKVTRFNDPKSALAAIKKTPEAFDLLVTDRRMPAMSGEALVHEARRLRPNLPVVYMSGGYVPPSQERNGMPEHTASLAKPFEVSELTAELNRLLP